MKATKPHYEYNGVLYDSDANDVAARFGKHVCTVRAQAKAGKIPHIRLGTTYLFNMAQVEKAIVKVNDFEPDIYDV
jgi:excisionase family DNA binding protein